MDGGGKAGVAGTDDTDIGVSAALQWRQFQCQVCRGGVPGIDVSFILHRATIPFCGFNEA
jgi:hypothetical protein